MGINVLKSMSRCASVLGKIHKFDEVVLPCRWKLFTVEIIHRSDVGKKQHKVKNVAKTQRNAGGTPAPSRRGVIIWL
jgi:hypothetical protein